MQHYNWDKMEKEEVLPGMTRRIITGERVMLVLYEMDPLKMKEIFPLHAHPHEQIEYIIQGKVEFKVVENGREETRILGPGDIVVIPPNVKHTESKYLKDAKVIELDIFCPPREDYLVGVRVPKPF